MRTFDLTFARRLEQAMTERNIYPSDLARKSGVSRSNIYNYIAGTSQPSAYNVKRIALALSTSADWLLGLVDQKNSPLLGTQNSLKQSYDARGQLHCSSIYFWWCTVWLRHLPQDFTSLKNGRTADKVLSQNECLLTADCVSCVKSDTVLSCTIRS